MKDNSTVLQKRLFSESPFVAMVYSSRATAWPAHWLGSAHNRRGAVCRAARSSAYVHAWRSPHPNRKSRELA